MRGGDGFISQRGCRGLESQIQEEYWTTVGYDGVLRDGRTTDDFLTFTGRNNEWLQNSFVAYWEGAENSTEITRSKYGGRHYEVFGHAFIKPDGRVCGWFVGLEQEVVEVCGGFRVLSRSRRNPHEPTPFEWVRDSQHGKHQALGFHNHKIAKCELNGDETFFGDADASRRAFSGVSPASETFVQINTPEEFHGKVWLLKKRDQPVDQRADYRTYEQYRSGK
uniref:Uncharacterized protein n=1 Tax=Caenorhabditis japonica TaxID=281687 RepID=A0A8R1EBM6_CAEJA